VVIKKTRPAFKFKQNATKLTAQFFSDLGPLPIKISGYASDLFNVSSRQQGGLLWIQGFEVFGVVR